MGNKVIVFGAGKIGRGFIGHLCSKSNRDIVFVDKDEGLISALKKSKTYQIHILNAKKDIVEINPQHCYAINDPSWLDVFATAEVCFTAVFGNNLEDLAASIAKGIVHRMEQGNDGSMNIITCENLSHAAAVLKQHVANKMHNDASRQYLEAKVGFVEGIMLKTCLSDPDHPVNVMVQDFNELPCDLDGFKGKIPDITGLKPLPEFRNQLVRKIYTYNCINAVMTYMGAAKGYSYLSEAAADPEIYQMAATAGGEASKALLAEFGFDPAEQQAWVQSALDKFADPAIPDPILRNAADPVRKLRNDDRLIGPANLALKHHVVPRAIIAGVLAALQYEDEEISMKTTRALHGVGWMLQQYCNLDTNDLLFQMIVLESQRK
ncbi:hypothetical protein [Chitinophaga sp. MM2321]|uniref:mannitol dehydrogenase family protein n=1 Tax=Chitinophaga sp. MM2321 TaxID=3137178 RepID=UPI0032D59BB6